MKHVFISHASKDYEYATDIRNELEKRGIFCWIAPDDIAPGKDYAEEIIAGIEGASTTILLLSAHANNSHFVRREIERAVSKSKIVIPIRIENVQPSTGLEFYISSNHWVELWQGGQEAKLDRVANLIKDAADPSNQEVRAESAAVPTQPDRHFPNAGKRKVGYLLAAVVVLTVAGVAFNLFRTSSPDVGVSSASPTKPIKIDKSSATVVSPTANEAGDATSQREAQYDGKVADKDEASISSPVTRQEYAQKPDNRKARNAETAKLVPVSPKPKAASSRADNNTAEDRSDKSAPSVRHPRCGTILQHMSLGETLTREEQRILQTQCK